MKVWMIWVQGDDATWLEAAWDDNMTYENPSGWKEETERVRNLAYENRYEMRIQSVEIPGVYGLFDIPEVVGEVARPSKRRDG